MFTTHRVYSVYIYQLDYYLTADKLRRVDKKREIFIYYNYDHRPKTEK